MENRVLTPKAQELFSKLSNFKDEFYLAGGTGLALQIGHRMSVDLDLFSKLPIKKTLLKKVEEIFPKESRQILVNNTSELTIIIDEVKITFLHYPFPVILPLNESGPIPILSVKEILATKAYTIGRRGELKDYIDLYIGFKDKHALLSETIDLADKKYGDAFNGRLFLEQLLYLGDVEKIEIIMIDGQIPSESELVNFFSELVKRSNLIR